MNHLLCLRHGCLGATTQLDVASHPVLAWCRGITTENCVSWQWFIIIIIIIIVIIVGINQYVGVRAALLCGLSSRTYNDVTQPDSVSTAGVSLGDPAWPLTSHGPCVSQPIAASAETKTRHPSNPEEVGGAYEVTASAERAQVVLSSADR